MKAMVCEMCNGNEIVKTNGVYVCQHCGARYAADEARKLVVEVAGPVSVQGIPTADNLMERAQEFFDEGNMERASEYVTRVLDIDAHDERARAMQRAIERGEGGQFASRAHTSQARMFADVPVSEEKYQQIVAEVRLGNKITAIKLLREHTGWGLAQSKEYVEDVLAPSLGITNLGVGDYQRIMRSQGSSSQKSRMVTFLLCLFLGFCGVHCFYAGRIAKGVLYFFTFGLFGLGWAWDIIQIARRKFTDGRGLPITA